MKTGVEIIAAERQRQIEKEGWTAEHDAKYFAGELALAAMCYATPAPRYIENCVPLKWPWEPKWWKPSPENRIKELAKAGALIAAEIDRLQNLKPAPPVNEG